MFIRKKKRRIGSKAKNAKTPTKTSRFKSKTRSSKRAEPKKSKVVSSKTNQQSSRKSFSSVSSKETNKSSGVVKSTVPPTQLVHARIIRGSKNAAGKDNKLDIQLLLYPEELLTRGYEFILVEVKDIAPKIEAKPTPESIRDALNRKIYRKPGQIVAKVDVKEAIDNFRVEKLQKGIIESRQDELQITPVVTVAPKKLELPFVSNRGAATEEESAFTDTTGNLELRLGGAASEKIGSAISNEEKAVQNAASEIRNAGLSEEEEDIAVDESSVAKEPKPSKGPPAILKVMNGKEFNKSNRRPFPGITKRELLMGSVKPNRTKMMNAFKQPKQRPKLQGLITQRIPRRMKKNISLQLPSAGKEVVLIIFNPRTGERRYKSVLKRPDFRISKDKVEFYKEESRLPILKIAPLDGNKSNVQVIVPAKTTIDAVEIWRRDISTRQFEDEYEKIQTLTFTKGKYPTARGRLTSSFNDVVSSEGIYKYVAVPIVNGIPMSLYSFRIYRTANWRAGRSIEPLIYGYQQSQRVVISIRQIPREAKKILLYRNSSLDGEEILVDGRLNYGRGRTTMRFFDYPSPVEQTIEYILKSVDDYGIVSQFDDKPLVKYNARLGEEPAILKSLVAKFNKDTESVDISGVFEAENAFESSGGDVLENPDDKTLLAASRGQKVCRLIVRRIDLTTGDDEILMSPIVNRGISAFDLSKVGDNRVRFSFSDNSTTAVENGYTPLFSNRSYLYVCRMAAYPLSVELRKVAGITKIKGIVENDRLKYEYDPFLFDHPSNRELGIMPASFSRKSQQELLQISTTSVGKTTQIYVPRFEVDVNINFEAKIREDYDDEKMVELKFSIPDALIDDLDHVELVAGVDSLLKTATIDRIFIRGSEETIYYDYQMLEQVGNSVTYQLKGIGKDFRKLFVSQVIEVQIPKEEEV